MFRASICENLMDLVQALQARFGSLLPAENLDDLQEAVHGGQQANQVNQCGDV